MSLIYLLNLIKEQFVYYSINTRNDRCSKDVFIKEKSRNKTTFNLLSPLKTQRYQNQECHLSYRRVTTDLGLSVLDTYTMDCIVLPVTFTLSILRTILIQQDLMVHTSHIGVSGNIPFLPPSFVLSMPQVLLLFSLFLCRLL